MTRDVKTVPIGGGGTRWRVVITDEPSTGAMIRQRQVAFLQALANDGAFTGMLHCGPRPFESFRMHHTGRAWVVEMEAEDLDHQGATR